MKGVLKFVEIPCETMLYLYCKTFIQLVVKSINFGGTAWTLIMSQYGS